MLGSHPFQRRPSRGRRPLLWLLTMLATLPVILSALIKPLREGDPGGRSIIDFELAGTTGRAEEILSAWDRAGVRGAAKVIQLIDFGYPLVYASALAGCCVAAAAVWQRTGQSRVAAAGIRLAWLAFAAAVFDYVENIGLDVALWSHPVAPLPQVSTIAAVLKFAGIAITGLYALSGLAAARLGSRP